MTNRVRKPSQARWRAFWEQREAAVGAPSVESAERVWTMLAPRLAIRPADLLPQSLGYCNLTPAEERELTQNAQRALLVALDVVVRALQDRRAVSLIRVFDTLAARWSARFRRAQK